MATKKISELTALTTPDGAEELVVNDGGTSKKITVDNIFNQDIDVTGTVTADGLTVDGSVDINADYNFTEYHKADGSTRLGYFVIRDNGDIIFDFDDTDSGYPYVIKANNQKVISAATNGDISFYDSTGNTPKFHWDAADESLNIGAASTTDTKLVILGGDYDPTSQGGKNAKGLSIRGGTIGLGNRTGAVTFSMNNGGANAGSAAICGVSEHATSDDVLGLAFFTHSSTSSSAVAAEAMRIDSSGNVGIGTTDADLGYTDGDDGVFIGGNGSIGVARSTTVGGHLLYLNKLDNTGNVVYFAYDGAEVGDITITASSTSYNTSSDYRLKENVVPMTGSIDRLKALNPSRFNFIADPDTTVDGFLAHEAQEVVPEAVTGTKDAMKTEEYEVTPALGEVFIPAVEEVAETTVVTPAIEAQDVAMGERQVTETVEIGTYVNLAGETITETEERGVTEETTETVVERQEIDGVITEVEVERTVNVPIMETYEVSPAVVAQDEVTETTITTEAVAEVILETNVEKPEEGQWREVTPAVMGEREVPDMQGIDQAKLTPLLTSALQEAVAKIEELEARLATAGIA